MSRHFGVSVQCGQSWLVLVALISLLFCPISSAIAQISSVHPAARELVRPPLIIVVRNNSTPASLTARQTIDLGAVGSPESVYTWLIDETRSKRIRDLDGKAAVDGDGQPFELARNNQGVVTLDWSTEKLSRKSPIELSVTVKRPGSLLSGVYRGEVWAELDSEPDQDGKQDELSRPLKIRWPVYIFVHGRAIKRISFDDQKPRVGGPASVAIDLETVDCELGDGALRLDAGSSERDLQLGLHLSLNRANFKREFIDPERVFYKDKFQDVNENWRLSTLRVSNRVQLFNTPAELSNVPHGITLPKVERHLIEIVAGDYYQPGFFQARLDWPQSELAPTRPSVPLSMTISTTVQPGIRVFPRRAAELEVIDVLVVADGGLPKQFQLIAAGPNAAEIPFQVTEVQSSTVAGQIAHRKFFGRFATTETRGIWTIGWPRPDQLTHLGKEEQKIYQILDAQVAQPATVEVCFQWGANLVRPLEVFASAEPIWWPFYWWNPLKATGWEYTRPKAIEFASHPDSLKFPQVMEVGWMEVLIDGRRIPYDSTTSNGPKLTIHSTSPTPAGSGPVWKIPEKGALELSTTVSLHPKEPHDPKERHRLGNRSYVWSAVLTGQDANNHSVARIIEIPVHVVVTTSWVYDSYLYLAVGGTLIIIAAMLGINFYRSNRGKHAKKTQVARPAADYVESDSTEAQFFGQSSADEPVKPQAHSASPSPSRNINSESEREASPHSMEPDSNDDSDDKSSKFFS